MEKDTSAVGPRTDLIPRLMGFARLVQGLAKRFKGAARFLSLTGLLAAVWLAFVAAHSLGFPTLAAVLAGGVLALPALVLGGVWFVLDQASTLPRRLADWLGRAHVQAGDTWQRVQGEPPPGQGRFKDLRPWLGLAYELRAMGADARDLALTLRGALALTNPLFLLAVGGSVLATVLLDVAAAVTGLLYLVR